MKPAAIGAAAAALAATAVAQTLDFSAEAPGAVGVWTKADSVTAFKDFSFSQVNR